MLDLGNKQQIRPKAPSFYQKNQGTLTYLIGGAMAALVVGFMVNPFKLPKAFTGKTTQGDGPQPQGTQAYNEAIAEINSARLSITRRYVEAPDQSGREGILREAKGAFEDAIMTRLLPLWMEAGGTSPGETVHPNPPGSYLVVTLLRDSGLNLKRKNQGYTSPQALMALLVPGTTQVLSPDTVAPLASLEEGLYLLDMEGQSALLLRGGGGSKVIVPVTAPSPGLKVSEVQGGGDLLSMGANAFVPLTPNTSLVKRWMNQAPFEGPDAL